MTFNLATERFITHLKIKAYQPATIVSYVYFIKIFREFCLSLGKTDLRTVTADDIKLYREYLMSMPWGFDQKSRSFFKIRLFFKYLAKEDYILIDPTYAQDLKLKGVSRLPQILTEEEVFTILNTPTRYVHLRPRDRALLELLYSCGLRSREVLNLKITDVDFKKGLLFVCEGKGKKDRVVPVGKTALTVLEDYLKRIRPFLLNHPSKPKKKDVPWLFLSQRTGDQMKHGTMLHFVRQHARKSGIKKRVYPHLFRHSMATHMIKNGAGLDVVQKMLGHDKVVSTMVYTHLDLTEVRKMLLKYHPRKAFKWLSPKDAKWEPVFK